MQGAPCLNWTRVCSCNPSTHFAWLI
jgi:hypothetical protein